MVINLHVVSLERCPAWPGVKSGDLMPFELARFTSLHNNPRFLAERTLEVKGNHYHIRYPFVDEFQVIMSCWVSNTSACACKQVTKH